MPVNLALEIFLETIGAVIYNMCGGCCRVFDHKGSWCAQKERGEVQGVSCGVEVRHSWGGEGRVPSDRRVDLPLHQTPPSAVTHTYSQLSVESNWIKCRPHSSPQRGIKKQPHLPRGVQRDRGRSVEAVWGRAYWSGSSAERTRKQSGRPRGRGQGWCRRKE